MEILPNIGLRFWVECSAIDSHQLHLASSRHRIEISEHFLRNQNINSEIFGNILKSWFDILGGMHCQIYRFSLPASHLVRWFPSEMFLKIFLEISFFHKYFSQKFLLKNPKYFYKHFLNCLSFLNSSYISFFCKYFFLKYFNASNLVSPSDQFHRLKMGTLFLHQLEIWKKVSWKFSKNLSAKIFNWKSNFVIEISASQPGEEIERNWGALIPLSSSPHFSRLPNGNGIWNLLPRNTFESYLAAKSFWFLVWQRSIMFRESP